MTQSLREQLTEAMAMRREQFEAEHGPVDEVQGYAVETCIFPIKHVRNKSLKKHAKYPLAAMHAPNGNKVSTFFVPVDDEADVDLVRKQIYAAVHYYRHNYPDGDAKKQKFKTLVQDSPRGVRVYRIK